MDEDAPARSDIGEHYVVDRELGRGGMATVYLCTDRRSGIKVAVKVLRQELGSVVVRERFLREIAFASELDHPRIPKVLDSGFVGDLPFYVMTYIDGESLKHLIEREKQLPFTDAIRIACEVIAPTAYAHSKGIVHRDIKPDNILITKDGVYVLDFGIARAIIESGIDRLTSTGIGVGTPAYMSPEQAIGDRNLDARSDIYSLGCVVYEMIAGIPPFVGPTAQVIISRRFAAAPPPLTEVREEVPESLENAVMKALARAPSDRWATAAEFGEALHACGVEPQQKRRRIAGLSARRPIVRAGIAALVVAVLAGGILAWSRLHDTSFEKAQEALQSWDLASAETELRHAVAAKPGDPVAQLWLAQVLMLRGASPPEWKPYALRASDKRAQLTPLEQIRSDAIVGLTLDNAADVCQRFAKLALAAQSNPSDYTPTLALADCLRDDRAVLPDPRSPSRYSFRSSYQLVESLYEGLLARNATNAAAYAVLMPKLEQVLAIDKGQYRGGPLIGDNHMSLLSHPSFASDTLAFIPYPSPASGAPWRVHDPEGFDAAISHNRQRLRGLAIGWIRIAPDDASAHAALARILESAGELSGTGLSALDEVKTARRLAFATAGKGSSLRRVRFASDQVRLYLRLKQFDGAGLLADSILAWPIPSRLGESERDSISSGLVPLAALRGRGLRTIEETLAGHWPQTARLATGEEAAIPAPLVPDFVTLEVYAACGGPRDSIVALAARLSEQLNSYFPERQIQAWRTAALERPLALAAPVTGPTLVAQLEPSSNLFALALRFLARGDRRRALVFMDSLTELHADYPAGQLTMDVVFGEAWLRLALGDTATATRALDHALDGLAAAGPGILRTHELTASLVRVMALRAILAGRAGQTITAKYWANAVFKLWGRGDAVTAATLESVQALR